MKNINIQCKFLLICRKKESYSFFRVIGIGFEPAPECFGSVERQPRRRRVEIVVGVGNRAIQAVERGVGHRRRAGRPGPASTEGEHSGHGQHTGGGRP